MANYHTILAGLFEQAFPAEYPEYRESFLKGRTTMPDSSSGAWLAQALLSNIQTNTHIDALDGPKSICGIINGGQYEPLVPSDLGTSIVFPDLGIAFE